ncbi:CAP domain-containing protein [Sporolactobacillus sp. CPB3-1]|uniref:CAP domain-containing protein n=1 Tax=Sporolactobacillus mangiferae TaxID=2940498 RepID=A0ABT0M8D3_9BACL|nr:CAP domain-containing protein [Sporolactobacillus mangiferae]MCL1631130.1 CAP domain-containing protein [Sporolactobacillus mangiferae]
MKKQIIGLTIAGALALPLVTGGGQAQAATSPKDQVCTKATTELFNPWKLQKEQIPDLDQLLKQLGISFDLSQLQEQLDKQKENAAPTTEAPKKDDTAQAEKPDRSKPQATEETQKPETPTQSEKPASDQSSQPSEQTSSKSDLNAYEQKVVDLTNQERTKAGLQPLKADNSALSKMARAKSQDMRDKNYFDHQSPTYGSPFDMMKKYGISYKSAGENIAAGQKTPEEVVQGWMNSPGHRANILNASFTTIGVGYVEGGSYGSYWTQEFIGN